MPLALPAARVNPCHRRTHMSPRMRVHPHNCRPLQPLVLSKKKLFEVKNSLRLLVLCACRLATRQVEEHTWTGVFVSDLTLAELRQLRVVGCVMVEIVILFLFGTLFVSNLTLAELRQLRLR